MKPPTEIEIRVLKRSQQCLRLATASLPHLSGLARLLRMQVTSDVPVAAIGRSGLLLVNPEIFATAPLADAAFVLAHEMMHLALDTHGRQGETDQLVVNFAHDYIINDMLMEELDRDVPLDGLKLEGARERSLEQLVVDLSRGDGGAPDLRCWSQGKGGPRGQSQARSQISRALEDAGLVDKPPPIQLPQRMKQPRGDVLPDAEEDAREPGISRQMRERLREEVRRAAAKAASLSELKAKIDQAGEPTEMAPPQRGSTTMEALKAAYETPWQLAMQRWFDAVGPGERTYARPSRRGGGRRDVVLPGRKREGWTLHILLDTSGSMVDIIPKALGAIAWFCDASGVAEVHLMQCDIEVTDDRWVEPQDIAEYKIAGFGGSDMEPGLRHLALDPEVDAALVLTDGYITFPEEPPPYSVLWCLIGHSDPNFSPPYGQVVKMAIE